MFEERIERMYNECHLKANGYVEVKQLLRDYGLYAVAVDADYVGVGFNWRTLDECRENTLMGWITEATTGKKYISIWFPLERKEEVRSTLFEVSMVDKWHKSFHIERGEGIINKPAYLVECWTVVHHDEPWKHDDVSIKFYTEAEEGMEVNGCKVEKKMAELKTDSLVIACETSDRH